MSIQAVNDNWQLFVERQLVTGNALSPQLFQTEANYLLHQFQTQTQVIVFQALQLIRTITHVDRLIAVLRVNSNTYIYRSESANLFNITTRFDRLFTTLDTLNFSQSINCSYISMYIDPDPSNIAYRIPSFYFGCFNLEAIVQSLLECFYDTTCIDIIKLFIQLTGSINVSALNSNKIRVELNATMETIVSELMIEQWNSLTNYSNYFLICAPQTCTYTVIERYNFLHAIVMVFGLYGGLIVAFRFLALFLVISTQRQQQSIL
ncbi:unnamed protein product [Rotaria sordida]|uniref:Uncharacterized protein n=1 Tax=Rotaria sordida TaxID=392033 RepID=A0A815JP94_9BILA|nr:unnamed protein product [Rotaria sordida]CAF1384032.1 unnamed protein product [Rotaria sordida]CAF3767874.1 unnamed protein product [Rotaria sordida]